MSICRNKTNLIIRNMKKLMLFITLTISSLILYECDYSDTKLTITNKSDKPITYAYSIDSILTGISLTDSYIAKQIKPAEKKIIYHRGLWSIFINGSTNKKVYFFFLDIDTLKKYNDMVYIRTHELYTKKIGLTEEELDKINWNIIYDK